MIKVGKLYLKPIKTNDNPFSLNFDITTAKFSHLDCNGEPTFIDKNNYFALLRKANKTRFCFWRLIDFWIMMDKEHVNLNYRH